MRISFYLLFIVLLFGCFHSESDDASPNPNPEPTPCELDPQSSPSCEGYVKPEPTPCELDPQSSPSCMGYVEPIDPCDLDPQSSPLCPGYVEPVDPCDLDPQSSPTCMGYVDPCIDDPLFSESCVGYDTAIRKLRSYEWVDHFVPGLGSVSKELFESKTETVSYKIFESVDDDGDPLDFDSHEVAMRCFASSLLTVLRDSVGCLDRENDYFTVLDDSAMLGSGMDQGTVNNHNIIYNSQAYYTIFEGKWREYKKILDEHPNPEAVIISTASGFSDTSFFSSKDTDFENGPAIISATDNVYVKFEDALKRFESSTVAGERGGCYSRVLDERYSCKEELLDNLKNHSDKIMIVTGISYNDFFQCSDFYAKQEGTSTIDTVSDDLTLVQKVCVRFPDSIRRVSDGPYDYFFETGEVFSGAKRGTSFGATGAGVLAYVVSRVLGLQTGAQALTVIKSCAVPNETYYPGELGVVDVECLFKDDGSLKSCDNQDFKLNVSSNCMDIEETVSVLGSMVLPGDISKLEMTDRYGRNFDVRVKLGGINFQHNFERPWLREKKVPSVPLVYGLSGGDRVLVNSFSFGEGSLGFSHTFGVEDDFFGFKTDSFVKHRGYRFVSKYKGLNLSFLRDFRVTRYRGSEIEGMSDALIFSFKKNLGGRSFLSLETSFSEFKEGKLHLGDSSYRIQTGAKDSSLRMSFFLGL